MVVHVGRDRARLALGSSTVLALAVLTALVDPSSGQGLLALCLDAVVFPLVGVGLARWARAQERTLVRAHGRLLLDGEPLELARVELRVLKLPITRVPTGYALSLWVMTASGPEDVPIGRSATLLEASALSGQLEDFVSRATAKQHRHA
jgi:hypothetical protein